ncbi:hypothetical protein [Epilithonimonas sp. JDS]|uniref:hypothetical protein n=1 Tax=Epilithonimonas sp. JDS TaxID=2902797 RepID=UPI001E45EBAE|nr:hypothetical protein [Epilithonimonas sp. JDS]
MRELLASNQLPEEKAVEIKMRLSEDLQDYHYYQSLIDLVHSVTTTPGETGKIQNELFY